MIMSLLRPLALLYDYYYEEYTSTIFKIYTRKPVNCVVKDNLCTMLICYVAT